MPNERTNVALHGFLHFQHLQLLNLREADEYHERPFAQVEDERLRLLVSKVSNHKLRIICTESTVSGDRKVSRYM